MQPLMRYLPHELSLDFIGPRGWAYLFTALLVVASLISIGTRGFNFGIDFAGGSLIEARSAGPADISKLREDLDSLGIGQVEITTIGDTGRDIMIRVQQQPGEAEQNAALKKVQGLLEGYEIRRTELVGPKVGAELVISSALAIALAIIAIAIYVWIRFEWQFALGACLALCHDVLTTVGIFSLFQMEFNLTVVAGLLTIAGYSVNDSIVVYDRVRENLRKYKTMPLPDLLNFSINRVFSRTLLTVFTVFLTVIALLVFGGTALRGFSIAMMWGLFVGTYSSIYLGLPVLLYFDLRPEVMLDTRPKVSQVPEYERN